MKWYSRVRCPMCGKLTKPASFHEDLTHKMEIVKQRGKGYGRGFDCVREELPENIRVPLFEVFKTKIHAMYLALFHEEIYTTADVKEAYRSGFHDGSHGVLETTTMNSRIPIQIPLVLRPVLVGEGGKRL